MLFIGGGISIIFPFASIAQNSPSWTEEFPSMRNYYIGIGYAEKKEGIDHIEEARINALSNISNEISIEINNIQTLNIEENNIGVVEEFYSYSSTTYTHHDIAGYELYDAYENNNEYWVFYRLSKEKFKSFKILEANRILEEIDANVKLIDSYNDQGEYLKAINIAVSSLKKIEQNIDTISFINSFNANLDLDYLNKIKNEIIKLNDSIDLVLLLNNDYENLSFGQELYIKIIDPFKSLAFRNIPVNVKINSRYADYERIMYTNKMGEIRLNLPSHLFDTDILDMNVSINYLQGNELENFEATRKILNIIANNSKQYYLRVNPLKITLEGSVDDEIVNSLSGYHIVKNGDYDFKLYVEIGSDYIGESFGIHSHSGWARVNVYKYENEKIKSITFEDIVGRHLNRDISRRNTLGRVQKEISNYFKFNIQEIFY
jgi:hypothetical protein